MPSRQIFSAAQSGNFSGILEVIVKYNGNILEVSKSLGGVAEILTSNYAIITLQAEKIPLLLNFSEVEFIEQQNLKPKPERRAG